MKSTKKSLLLSALSLTVCVMLLIGTTFAWFTDSVTSGRNTIKAGNLDIELEYLDTTGDEATWKTVTEDTKLFDDDALWEPGYTEVVYLKLSNKGTLALKYNLGINVYSEVAGTNAAGESFKLSDYIHMGVDEEWGSEEEKAYEDRAAARAAVGESGVIATYTKPGNMAPGTADTKTFAIVVYMPENVENAANYKTGTTPPSIVMGIEVAATQLTSEKDSFDKLYDAGAPWLGDVDEVPAEAEDEKIHITTAEEFAGFAKAVNAGNNYNGKTIVLDKDIDLNNVAWTPIGNSSKAFNGVFDGQNHTILNLKTSGEKYVGLFGRLFNYGTVKNVNVKNANVTGVAYVGVIAGAVYGNISNCKVDTATVTANVGADGKDGAKAGSITGFIQEGESMKLTGCSAKNVTINGYRDLGGIVGALYGDNTVTGNTVEGVVINQQKLDDYDDGDTTTLGAIYGRNVKNDGGTLQENESAGATINKAPAVIKAATEAAITEALSEAETGDTIKLTNTGAIKLPDLTKNVTLKGNSDGSTKIDATGSGSIASVSNGATFDSITFDLGQDGYHGFQHAGKITMKNCTLNGLFFTYGDMEFVGCTFNQTAEEYVAWIYGAGATVIFKDCTFNVIGKTFNVYNEGNGGTEPINLTVEGCTFNSSKKNKAAVNIKDTCGSNHLAFNVIIKDSTTNENFPEASTSSTKWVIDPLVMVDDISLTGESKVNVTLNDVVVFNNSILHS